MLTAFPVVSSPWTSRQTQDCSIGAAGEAYSSSSCCLCHSCVSVMRNFPRKLSVASHGFSSLKTWISTIGFRAVPNQRTNHWPGSLRSLASTTQAETHLRSFELKMGRLRRVYAATMVVAGCAAGWLWLGNSGAALLGLWAWSAWPRWTTRRVTIDLSRLRFARLGVKRVFWVEQPLRAQQIFADEVIGAQYAELRRLIKSKLSGGRSPAR